MVKTLCLAILVVALFQLSSSGPSSPAVVAMQIIMKDSSGNEEVSMFQCEVPESSNSSDKCSNAIQKQLVANVTRLQNELQAMTDNLKHLEKKVLQQSEGRDNITEAFKGINIVMAKSPYSNRLYIFPTSEKATFAEAKKFCEQRSTTLASIHSEGENRFAEEWLSTHFKVYSHFWLGHERPSEVYPGWHDGTPLDYTSWGPVDNSGQPNPAGCMFMCHYCGANINGWYIRPCTDSFNFLCQKVLA